jgi:hypothetical protein
MGRESKSRTDSACVVNANGSMSNAGLHEQMVEGVDDRDFRVQTRAELHAAGVPAAALNSLFSDLPPLEED